MEQILFLVKTYPTLSSKYGELVCTAGIRDNGQWVRVYPLPFRRLDELKKFKKFQWVNIRLERNKKDMRPESFRPVSTVEMSLGPEVKDWYLRRQWIDKTEVFTDLSALVERAKGEERLSLATFKPTKILKVVSEPTEREWNADKLADVLKKQNQPSLFESEEDNRNFFDVVHKVPYKFSYTIEDEKGHVSTMMIEDWEIGMLYFHCLWNQAKGDESVAVKMVLDKYQHFIDERDVYLFLGTTLSFHAIAKQPFIIIGVFAPPKLPENKQQFLFNLT